MFQASSIANKLDNTGGVLTGNITVASNINVNGSIVGLSSYFESVTPGSCNIVYNKGAVDVKDPNSDQTFTFENTNVDGISNTLMIRPNGGYCGTIGANSFVMGNVYLNVLYRSYEWSLSDERRKTNIIPLSGMAAKCDQIAPCTFDWKEDGAVAPKENKKNHAGFIAQRVAAVDPHVVYKDSTDMHYISSDGMLAMLWQALREKRAKVVELRGRLSNVAAFKMQTQNIRGIDLNEI